MKHNLISTKYFPTDPLAESLHEEGLSIALDPNMYNRFSIAHTKFEQALRAVELDTKLDLGSKKIQNSRIIRDDGFTYTRQLFSTAEPSTKNQQEYIKQDNANAKVVYLKAMQKLQESAGLSFDVYNTELPIHERREATTEFGETLGLMARTVTALCVRINGFEAAMPKIKLANTDIGKRQDVKTNNQYARELYDIAHMALKLGNNGYYRTSNAVNAARHERLVGKRIKALRWMGRGAAGLAWTTLHDRTNVMSSAKTFARHALDLRTKTEATMSVAERP